MHLAMPVLYLITIRYINCERMHDLHGLDKKRILSPSLRR